jgi:hypothetical protein
MYGVVRGEHPAAAIETASRVKVRRAPRFSPDPIIVTLA